MSSDGRKGKEEPEKWSRMDVGGQINEIATPGLFISIKQAALKCLVLVWWRQK
jgi:hypothetical protein